LRFVCERYFPEYCPQCRNKKFEILKKEMSIGHIVVVDFPHIRCMNCGTKWVASDLVFPIEDFLAKNRIACEKMTFEELCKLIDEA
jgi:uncharacterized Zn finger protein